MLNDEVYSVQRLTWFGHVIQMDPRRLPRKMLFWEPPGRKRPGRQQMRWKDVIGRDLKEITVTYEKAVGLPGIDREGWST